MIAPGGDGCGVGDARDSYGCRRVLVGAVAELAAVAAAPAGDCACGVQGARVACASGDGCGVGDACDSCGCRRVLVGAVAELAAVVVAPTGDRSVGVQGARVVCACGDGCGVVDVLDECWGSGVEAGGAVAELSAVVVAPAGDRAVGVQGARMTAGLGSSCGDGRSSHRTRRAHLPIGCGARFAAVVLRGSVVVIRSGDRVPAARRSGKKCENSSDADCKTKEHGRVYSFWIFGT